MWNIVEIKDNISIILSSTRETDTSKVGGATYMSFHYWSFNRYTPELHKRLVAT